MSDGGFFRRMFSWLRSEEGDGALGDGGDGATRQLTGDTVPAEPEVLRSQEEIWLDELIAAASAGERQQDVSSAPFWSRIDGLWDRGDERLAAQLVEKFIDMPTTSEDARLRLRARLVEMFDRRGDLRPALPHLEVLTRASEHATRAHYLLAEHYRRVGQEAKALRNYEAVLAVDVQYPNVRLRVERLRARRGLSAPGNLGETIVGPEATGATPGTRYRLVRELGRGAAGVVYLARDAELERDVAVKLLHPHLGASNRRQACSRFFDEARVAASLRHPNILAILDIDEAARRIVMELAAGGTLKSALEDDGPLTFRRALERHVQILSALLAAHRRGVVHRDLKPANLMFRRPHDAPGAEIVLGDFGVAHLPDAEGQSGDAKAKRDPVGTLAYMAPEQRRGDPVDPNWDLYAAGLVLFQMLTAKLPWPRDVLLSGTRTASDFTLPDAIGEGVKPRLFRATRMHLLALGHPDGAERPTTREALEAAQSLRDTAIADGLT